MQGRRVVLFQPRYVPPTDPTKPVVPVALLSLAAAVEPAGFEAQIIDAQVEPDALDRLRDLAPRSLAVGITSMTGYQIQGALAAAEAARQAAPDVPIIWGGWHPSLCPEQTAADPLVDIVVRGPGEQTLVELLQCRLHGQPWERVLGITFRRNGQIVSTPDRPIEPIDPNRRLPFEKLRMDCYGGRILHGENWGANLSPSEGHPFVYISSNGCPYRCRFCAATRVYKRRWLALPVEKTLDELELLHRRYGKEVFSFFDPEFFINARRVEGIARGILERGLRIYWKAQVRPEHIVRLGAERMRLVYQAGCRQLEIGAESGSPDMLQRIWKDSTPRAALESAAMLRGIGIIPQYNLMFGFPGEEDRHVRESLEFAAELKRRNPECLLPIYFFSPHPGIPLEEEARQHGYVPPRSLRQWAYHNPCYSEPVMPWIRNPQRLKDLLLRTITFYFPLAFPGDVTRGTLRHVRSRMRRLPDALWLWPAHLLSRLRVALKFYDLPWEWRLFQWARSRTAGRHGREGAVPGHLRAVAARARAAVSALAAFRQDRPAPAPPPETRSVSNIRRRAADPTLSAAAGPERRR